MTKRRRLDYASNSTREGDQSASDYDGSASDASNHNRGETRKRKATKKKVATSKPSASRIEKIAEHGHEGNALSHSSSSHIIKSPIYLQTALLQWYQTVHATRGMPWRKPYDPHLGVEERGQRAYEVWVSEIMLQQTQVATVIPYYTRWMDRFPTIRDLAAANVDQVNALWKGLGYYSRASRLLSGAHKAVAEYNGMLPDNAKDMEAHIPGIGRYSAGAISSIAYGERVPVLDGNVHRLLSRVLAVHAPPKAKATLDILWSAAGAMVESEATLENPSAEGTCSGSPQYPGDINQALIELGSTVCKVRDPACDACPLRTWCRAYEASQPGYKPITDIEDACTLCEPLQESSVTAYPMKVDRKKPREELDIVNVIEWRRVLAAFCALRRSDIHDFYFLDMDAGLLAGLYEFPTSSNVAKTTSHTAQAKIPQTLLGQLLTISVLPFDPRKKTDIPNEGLMIKTIKPVGDVIHIFSHIKKTYRPQWVVIQGGESPPAVKDGGVSDSIHGTEDGWPRPKDAMWVRLEDVSGVNIASMPNSRGAVGASNNYVDTVTLVGFNSGKTQA
ncbi:hypothetical protein DXG01_006827 [Tephrocybe rancida]|nr:hypothetical protein DXG01_006827 [Tephrocybe rancida]